jgi:hypothetical protein
MADKATEHSAWIYYFNQALSDLTGMTDDFSDGEGIKISGPSKPSSLATMAEGIADAAIAKLKERNIHEDFWPTHNQ